MSPEEKLLLRLDELIESEFKNHKDSEFYASCLCLSLKVLNKILAYHRQVTVHRLLQKRIYQEAIYLLGKTNMTIKEITYELGIDDPAYFCRRFKILTGNTPKSFRFASRL